MAFASSAIPETVKVLPAPIEGYDIVPLKWTGKLDNRGEDVTLEGTVEEITSKVKKTNPDFGLEIRPEKRAEFGKVNCGWGGSGKASGLAIGDGIKYLNGFGDGYCGLDDGPYKCARISCSYNSAIWLCNDNDTPLRVRCGDLEPFIRKIVDDCYTWGFGEPMVQGQIFTNENWNVILGKDKC
ncbi:hypothetical protein N0V84_009496 [Fusarium piperis]|uniref:Uncharacterized protein n=1 Tax=Fusarium piperis TaxID=1435070 RepID=A0A9W8W696_9HYPO|nr:hypothetical protein N0V84_009496 [Fusarium piperis]